MVLFILQRFESPSSNLPLMGRLTVHTHGAPKEKAMKRLIDMYGERIQGRGVGLEHHPAKLSGAEYVTRLLAKKGTLVLLDEGGVQDDSITFAQRFEAWQLSSDNVHLAVGPAEGWPEDTNLNSLLRLSLSEMTFPHELAAVMLVEQLYRATELQRGSGYHKA